VPLSRKRLLATLGAGLLVASLVVPATLGVHFHALGLVQALLGSLLLVGASALAFNGSRPTPLPVRRAVPAVLATTAANAVTPAGIGGNLVMMRIHRKSGLSAEQAAAAAGLRTSVGAITATTVTAVVASSAGVDQLPSTRAGLLVVLGVVAILGVTTVLAHETRRKVRESAGRFRSAVWDVVRRPRCAISLVVGCAGVTLAQLLTLQGAVHAVGGHIAIDQLLIALVGSSAARSAVPSPGGVGPIEAALIGGLTALGMHWEAAATAVAVYRTAGHWMPVVAGMLSMSSLRRRQLV
jgi:uncharacterized membrane protein YbhN (UPF0104 family)